MPQRTGLRGTPIVLAPLLHFGVSALLTEQHPGDWSSLGGWVGVDPFFVIFGLLIGLRVFYGTSIATVFGVVSSFGLFRHQLDHGDPGKL